MSSLIIGYGEVGRGLHAAMEVHQDFMDIDINAASSGIASQYDILQICFPYSENFEKQVKAYQDEFTPKYTVIHSTVPIGTSRRLGAVHSPIRGIHPDLAGGIKTFPKFLAGFHASDVADFFRKGGLKVILFDDQETTELGKLLDTLYFGVCIEFAKEAKTLCDKNGLSFHEVYTLFNETYNKGYTELGHPEFVRPVLQPIMTPIGGHCVMPNASITESDFAQFLLNKNAKH